MVKRVAEVLSLFGNEEGFKFITHGFDLTKTNDFIPILNKCRIMIAECNGLIPEHLYDLLFGFLYGDSWEDAEGKKHSFYCSSDECIQWCLNNPGVHPKSNPQFENDFDAFKNSIRMYDRRLFKIFKDFESKFPTLVFNIDRKELNRVDFYIDIARLKQAIFVILDMMSDPRFAGEVMITVVAQPDTPKYQVRDLIIEQKGSYSDKSVQYIRERILNGSGDLSSIKNILEGTAYWSIESMWAEGPVRMNLLKEDIFQSDFEKIDASEVSGFKHIIRLYNKPQKTEA